MRLPVAARIARRELRGGLRGFYIFLACLALGVGAIAAVGSVRESVERGLAREGARLLGGDADLGFTYRFAAPDERAWMARNAARVSEVVTVRSMAVAGGGEAADRALTEVKSVDDAYPLYGSVALDPAMPLDDAIAGNGAVMDRTLARRLGLSPGDTFRLGTGRFTLRAILEREPDDTGGGFGLGPRTLLRTAALRGSGLLAAGTLFDTDYRLAVPDDTDLAALAARAAARFADTGMEWRDARDGAPGVAEFVERMGAFLVLVGIAGLAVGGVGVAAAVRAYLEGKTETIAVLKTLGAQGRTILAAYLVQIGVLAALGIAVGLALGAVAPLAFAPLIEARLPVRAAIGIYPGPLAEAALYGGLTAALFTLWPVARTGEIRAAALFRDIAGPGRARPGAAVLGVSGALLAALVAAAAGLSATPRLALAAMGGLAGAAAVLALAAAAIRRAARRASRARAVRGATALRLALGAVGGPGSETTSVMLSLGLGLSVLAAIGQIDTNLRRAIAEELPETAPSYFVLDIRPDRVADFRSFLRGRTGVQSVETAPMLRGAITRIDGRPAREVAGGHWMLEGDHALTYSARPGEGVEVTAGAWWPPDYDGPPQISFAAEEAGELGLGIGDTVTLSILGRPVTARVTSFRDVDVTGEERGFLMTMDPAALRDAPHSFVATIEAAPGAEAGLLRPMAERFPTVTPIRVSDVVARVGEVLSGLAAAVTYAASATLATGLVVLIGAAAAGERMRVFEAAVLKTVGAARALVLAYFALRSAMLGAAAGGVAIAAGGLAGWAVVTFVMDLDFAFAAGSALAIVAGGAAATLLAGLAFAWRPLAARPARVLRARE